jgi:hypothetical protein
MFTLSKSTTSALPFAWVAFLPENQSSSSASLPCRTSKPITSNIQTKVGAEVQAIVAVPVYSGSGTLFSIGNPTTTGTSRIQLIGTAAGTPYFYIDND